MMLDRGKPFGTVMGHPEARFSQDGRLFDGSGCELGSKRPAPVPAAPPPPAVPGTQELDDPPPARDPKDLRGKSFAQMRGAAFKAGFEDKRARKPQLLAWLRANGFTVEE